MSYINPEPAPQDKYGIELALAPYVANLKTLLPWLSEVFGLAVVHEGEPTIQEANGDYINVLHNDYQMGQGFFILNGPGGIIDAHLGPHFSKREQGLSFIYTAKLDQVRLLEAYADEQYNFGGRLFEEMFTAFGQLPGITFTGYATGEKEIFSGLKVDLSVTDPTRNDWAAGRLNFKIQYQKPC